MTLVHKKLFGLRYLHEYYIDGVTTDLSTVPTVACQKALKRLRLLFREHERGFDILYQSEKAGNIPYYPIPANTTFSFVFGLKQLEFLNITDITISYGNLIHYSKPKNGNVLASQSLKIIDRGYDYQFYKKNASVLRLELFDQNKKLVFKREITGNNGNFSDHLDLSNLPSGPILFKTMKNQSVVQRENFYLNNEPYGTKSLGHVDLQFGTTKDYLIQFTTKSSPWRYFLVMNKSLSERTYKVKLEGRNDNGRYSKVDLSFENQPTEMVIENKEVVLFESGKLNNKNKFIQHEIPLYEEQINNLKLIYKNKNSGSVEVPLEGITLINNLPKPSINQLKSEVFIYI